MSLLPTTQKVLKYSYIQQNEKVHVSVQGGVFNIIAEEPGITINGEGPFFVPLSQLRAWVTACEAQAHDQAPEEDPGERSGEGLPEEADDRSVDSGEAPKAW